ncbi:MAG: nuclear transport factor 2 family protein [Marinobacter sp.]|uniref:nuclear transport factor 2 family protein n=1 Tax=Marinobacter sp. TaxID=50741 RepID=UPI00329A0259
MHQNAPNRLATLYARYIDDRDFERLSEIMTDDIEMSAPEFKCTGLAEFTEVLQQLHQYSATMHLIGNQFGEWKDGGYQGETYCIATHIYEKDGVERKWEVGIRYQDTIVDCDGNPLYSHRYLNVLWDLDQPLKL